MPSNAKTNLRPKLRFPEFRNDPGWAEKELHTIADPVCERAENEDENNILTLSGEHGLVLQSEYFGKQIAGANADRYLKIRRDDFVYNDRTTKASAYGTIKRLTRHPHGIVSPIYKCFRFKEGELPGFWGWYFEAGAHESQLRSLANEGARAGRFNVSIDRFLSTSVWAPDSTSQEQKQIAECLGTLDELVGAESQKLDALTTHKRGLMQHLFPREGETLPRLRFPEFQDAADWKESKFKEVVARSFYGTSESTSEKGRYPVLRMGNMADGQLDFSNLVYLDLDDAEFKKLRLRRGDILLNRTNSYELVGKISLFDSEVECIAASYIVIYRLKPARIVPRFCNYLLNTGDFQGRIKVFATIGVSQANINPTTFQESLTISLPEPLEQQAIASCLSSLDDLIAAQSDKLEALKTHKRGLMQQLFPSPSEAEA